MGLRICVLGCQCTALGGEPGSGCSWDTLMSISPHPWQAASISTRSGLGPQEAHSPGAVGGKQGAVTTPSLLQTLSSRCILSPTPHFLPSRSLCWALQVHREDHGGDGAVVSSGHHPTLCQQPCSGSANLSRAKLQQTGARPAKPPAPLLVSPHPAITAKEGGFPEK